MRYISPKHNKGFTLVELLASMALLALIAVMVFTIFNQATKVWQKAGARSEQFIAARTALDQIAREIKGAIIIGTYELAGPDAGSVGQADFFVFSSTEDESLPGWRGDTEQQFSDQVYFVAPVENSGRQDYALIGYWVRDPEEDTERESYDSNKREHVGITNSSDDQLMRHFITDGGGTTPSTYWSQLDFSSPDGAGASQVLAENVKSLRIRCWTDYDSTEFTEVWESERPADTHRESKVNWDTVSLPGGSGFVPDEPYDDGVLPKAVKITIVVQDSNNVEKEREFSTIVFLDNAKR